MSSRLRLEPVRIHFTEAPIIPRRQEHTIEASLQHIPPQQIILLPVIHDIKTAPEPIYTHPHDTYMSGYPAFEPPPSPQIISTAGAFNNSQSSSPETIYGVMKGPTSQPRSAPYVAKDDFHSGYEQQQPQSRLQQQYTGPFETPVYSYSGTTQSSYPPQVGVPGIQLQYSRGHPELAFSRSQADLSLYSQQPLHQAQTQSQAQAEARTHAQQHQNQRDQQGYPFHRQ